MQKLQYQGENAKYMHARQNFTHEERASGMQMVKNLPFTLGGKGLKIYLIAWGFAVGIVLLPSRINGVLSLGFFA